MKSLVLEIPGDVADAMRLPEGEKPARVRLELALSLYAQGILGLGKAAQPILRGQRKRTPHVPPAG